MAFFGVSNIHENTSEIYKMRNNRPTYYLNVIRSQKKREARSGFTPPQFYNVGFQQHIQKTIRLNEMCKELGYDNGTKYTIRNTDTSQIQKV